MRTLSPNDTVGRPDAIGVILDPRVMTGNRRSNCSRCTAARSPANPGGHRARMREPDAAPACLLGATPRGWRNGVAWEDRALEVVGFDPRSLYVETFWLPILGPSAILLLRRLADRLEAAPSGFALAV